MREFSKGPQNQFDFMKPDDGLEARFLKELYRTLDLKETLGNLGLSEGQAKAILKGLVEERSGGSVHKKPEHEAEPHHKAVAQGVYEVYVDGASRGNPGPAGAGAVIKAPDGEIVKKLKKYLNLTTNNMAEYSALLTGLEAAKKMGIRKLRVFADSELMVRQMNGVYKVKSEDLRTLYEKAKTLMASFEEARISHVYREKNCIADALANEAIDGHKG